MADYVRFLTDAWHRPAEHDRLAIFSHSLRSKEAVRALLLQSCFSQLNKQKCVLTDSVLCRRACRSSCTC